MAHHVLLPLPVSKKLTVPVLGAPGVVFLSKYIGSFTYSLVIMINVLICTSVYAKPVFSIILMRVALDSLFVNCILRLRLNKF